MRTPAYEKKIAAAINGVFLHFNAHLADRDKAFLQTKADVARLRRLLRFYGAIAVLALIVAVVTR